jgi:hypothetical protein
VDVIPITFIWGLQPSLELDPNRSRWDTPNNGHIKLDQSFNIVKKENQERMVEICELISKMDTQYKNVKCSMRNFKGWVTSVLKMDFPLEEEAFKTLYSYFTLFSGSIIENGFIKNEVKSIAISFEIEGFK